jgi:Membrane-bound metallopeptidase
MKSFLVILLLYFVSIFDPTVTKATTLSEKDSIRAQIGQGWSLPIGLPINLNMFARIKIELKPDGTYLNVELIEDGQEFDEVFLDSISRALELAQPLKVPKNNYERWKDVIIVFDANHLYPDRPIKLTEYQKKKYKEDEEKKKKKKIEAKIKKLEQEIKTVEKFEEEMKKKVAEAEKNLNFIDKIFGKNNLIALNCFQIKKNTNTHERVLSKTAFKIFIDDNLKKAVEIYPDNEVIILHNVRSNEDFFYLDLHSVKVNSGFYSKEEIIIENFLYQK